MPLIQLIVLAIVQGLTEFLPISSSAHLILAPLLVEGWADQGPLIDVAAHVGSLFAVMLYFRRDTGALVQGAVHAATGRASGERKLFLMIAAATLPVLAAGGFLVATGLDNAMRGPRVIAAASIGFGVLLWLADRAPTRDQDLSQLSWREALLIGLAQTFAVVPGASRSGVTMTAARWLGWSRPEAARFSMLLAMPTIAAFGLFAALKLVTDGAAGDLAAAAIVAALSFLAAFAAIAVFMRLTRSVSFTPFVAYRILLGGALLIYAEKLSL